MPVGGTVNAWKAVRVVSGRGLEVLRAIVHDYVSTREPVGSKAIVDRHGFGVSAATIRNDMAALEDEHLIAAPHTSSGRIPTDLGYRVFVDHLAETKQLSLAQRNAIERFLGESDDFDDLLTRTVRTLSGLTNQVAVVQYPSLGAASVKHIELVRIGDTRIMSVLIADNGRVEQRIVDVEFPVFERDVVSTDAHHGVINEAELIRLRNQLNALCASKTLVEVSLVLSREVVIDSVAPEISRAVIASLLEQVAANRHERLILAGTANLLRTESDFTGSLYPVLDAIEEQVVVLKLLTEMTSDSQGLAVSIGHEHAHSGLDQTSLIASGFSSSGETSHLGLIGPTRMDYSGNIAAVRAVARYLTALLDSRAS